MSSIRGARRAGPLAVASWKLVATCLLALLLSALTSQAAIPAGEAPGHAEQPALAAPTKGPQRQLASRKSAKRHAGKLKKSKKKKRSARGKRKAARAVKAATRKVASVQRAPASAPEVETQVFSETTNFESQVESREGREGRSPASSFTPSARVIVIRRELGLTEAETARSPQDIVLNAGTESGIQEGMVFSVARSVPVLDPYKENRQAFLQVEFATIKVVHAQDNLSVARVEKIHSAADTPAVGTRAVLVGDYVGKFK